MSNNGGVVSVTGGYFNAVSSLYLINQPVISFSNASISQYNGPCYNSFLSGPDTLSCFQSSSIGQGASTGNVAIGSTGYGNTAVTMYQGAELLDALNYSMSDCGGPNKTPCINSDNMTLEPNNAAWAAGDTVENSHHYSAQFHTLKSTYTVWNPMVQNNESIAIGMTGLGASNGMPAINVANTTPNNLFVGHGGTATPPAGMNLVGTNGNGIFNSLASMQYAPEPSGTSLIVCRMPGREGVVEQVLLLQPDQCWWQQLRWSDFIQSVLGRDHHRQWYGACAVGWRANQLPQHDRQPALLGDGTPTSTLTTGTGYGTLLDNTTYYYKVAAAQQCRVFIVEHGGLDHHGQLRQQFKLHQLAVGRVQGATIYQWCGRATSGGELQIATTSGVDNTLYVDTGSATPSGSCYNTATQPGVDEAGYVGINSPGTDI